MTPIEWTRWIRPLEVRMYYQGFSGRKALLPWDARRRATKLKRFIAAPQMWSYERRVWIDHLRLNYPLAWDWLGQREDCRRCSS